MLTFTRLPPPASSIPGTSARAMKKGPFTLVSTSIFQTSGPVPQKWIGSVRNSGLTSFIPRPAVLDEYVDLPEPLDRPGHDPLAVLRVTSARIASAFSR